VAAVLHARQVLVYFFFPSSASRLLLSSYISRAAVVPVYATNKLNKIFIKNICLLIN
jgi:hypothetical protein